MNAANAADTGVIFCPRGQRIPSGVGIGDITVALIRRAQIQSGVVPVTIQIIGRARPFPISGIGIVAPAGKQQHCGLFCAIQAGLISAQKIARHMVGAIQHVGGLLGEIGTAGIAPSQSHTALSDRIVNRIDRAITQ